ncbi:serine hydrolase [Bosea sp. PAMC 26642]|nr:serine hydrolase [Bosea sp. PAMC 26642]
MVGAFDAGELKGLHGIVVARHGKLVFEHYFPGTDEIWGTGRGVVAFNAAELHDLRSVTKSLVGLLYGIALEDGLVPAPESTLLDAFPDYADLAGDPARRKLTIAHVLSMTMGADWDESSIPYSDPRNSEIAMERAPDRYRFILERPILKPPGESWNYSGGATALLGHLIAKGSGGTLNDFAKAKLFGPLGITETAWIKGFDGRESAASGLRMRPRDLTRIGQLVLDQGSHGGRSIVSTAWLKASFTRRARIEDGFDYGYQWYLGQLSSGAGTIVAIGNGGQRMTIVPALGLVAVVTAGNYNRPDGWKLPVKLLTEYVLAGLVQR